MEYKGYTARVEFDQDAGLLFGEVEGLRDVVTFESADVGELQTAFHESVDDYLTMCAERGEAPEKPYSGKFLVRVDPSLHREVALAAARAGKSLNAFASEVFKGWVERAQQVRPPRPLPGPNVSQPPPVHVFFERKEQPIEIAAGYEHGLELWTPERRNTPDALTPDTPSTSLTPESPALKSNKAA